MGLRDWIRRLQPARRASLRPPTGLAGDAASPTTNTAATAGSITYAPENDGEPDPGEIVWGWVAYEEDASRGKDRPVLVLAERDGRWACLMLSSKDHDRDAAQEARWGRVWIDIGAGGWDPQGRPSEVRLDRLIWMRRSEFRREGAALDQEIFATVVAQARHYHEL